jgi:AcrR family transcriptional regulator
MSAATTAREVTRTTIIEVAAALLREHGPATLTTRRVAHQAGVQQPTIYRLFGDKDGLLDAVAEQLMVEFAAAKARDVEAAAAEGVDPLEDLHVGWRAMIDFGVANPALFRLLSDPERVARSPAARAGRDALAARVRRLAAAGRLRVSEPRAVAMIQAAGTGTIQTLLATPEARRDLSLADAMYETVVARIVGDADAPTEPAALGAAVTLRALVPDLTALSPAERRLLGDWLTRIIDAA